MAIKEEKPITMAEVASLVGDSEKGVLIKEFIKGFTKMSSQEAKDMKKELSELKILKLKDSHLVKVIDFLPADITELNKILSEVSLDQEEITKILDVVKKH